jgi:hypothetical protein
MLASQRSRMPHLWSPIYCSSVASTFVTPSTLVGSPGFCWMTRSNSSYGGVGRLSFSRCIVTCLGWVTKRTLWCLISTFDYYTVTIYCFTSAGTHLKLTIHDFKFCLKAASEFSHFEIWRRISRLSDLKTYTRLLYRDQVLKQTDFWKPSILTLWIFRSPLFTKCDLSLV